MNDEIQVLDQLLLPLLEDAVKRNSLTRHAGLSPMVLEDSKLEEFINSDPTVLHYFQNFCTDVAVPVGGRESPTPSDFNFHYSETDYGEYLIPSGLFMLCGNGDDGCITCFSVNDRKVYSMNPSWSDDYDWRKSYFSKWDSLKEYVDYLVAAEKD